MSLDHPYSDTRAADDQRDRFEAGQQSDLTSGSPAAASDAANELTSSNAAAPHDGRSSSSPKDLEFAIKEREASLAQEIALREQKVAELERAFRAALRDRELSAALADKPLLPGAAAQLVKLWKDDVEVVDNEGEYQVFTRDGRSLSQAVEAWLANPEYAHFCQPSSRGGTALKGANRPASPGAARPTPKNLGEAVVLRWQEALARSRQEASPFIKMGRRR